MKKCTGCGCCKELFFQLRCYECRSKDRKKYSDSIFRKVCPICNEEHKLRRVVECSIRCRLKNRSKKVNDCWEWQGFLNENGYGQIVIEKNKFFTHRISYSEFIGPILNGLCVLHKCDNRKCCNPDHLFLGTRSDNVKDMVDKKRNNHGNVENIKRNSSSGRFEHTKR